MDIALAWLLALVTCLALVALAACLFGVDSRDLRQDDRPN
jgi:hypothetical protein